MAGRMATVPREGGPLTLRIFVLWIALPYLIGFHFSKYNLDCVRGHLDTLRYALTTVWAFFDEAEVKYSEAPPAICFKRLQNIMHNGRHKKHHDQPFANLTIYLHKNGDARPCGHTTIDIMQGLEQLFLEEPDRCPLNFDRKHQLDALWTRLFHKLLGEASLASSSCYPPDKHEEPASSSSPSFLDYCDAGPKHTPILPDHNELVAVTRDKSSQSNHASLPCHFHTYNGVRLTTLPVWAHFARRAQGECVAAEGSAQNDQAASCALSTRALHLVAVPAGRVFMFAASAVDDIIPLPHIARNPSHNDQEDSPEIYLRVLSVQPRLFEIHHFFDRHDSDDLVAGILREDREAYRVKRSSTGANGYHTDAKRTSESGFDTNSPVALKLKKRGMALLGFDDYIEGFTDGLQILRYNQTTAYNSHMDWMNPADSTEYDFESGGVGGNRFATILLYLSSLEENEGGETLFPHSSVRISNESEVEVRTARTISWLWYR